MNNKFKNLLLIVVPVIILLGACQKYIPEIPTYIPEIEIEGTQATAYQKVIGDTLLISPIVKYGNETSSFSFKWFKLEAINGQSSYQLLSKEPRFEYVLDRLGESTFRLEVTNDNTGIMTSRNIYVSVNSRAERALYLLKENSDGNTDMDALFISASRGDFLGENLITLANGKPLLGSPVGIGFIEKYRSVSYDTTTIPNRWVNNDFSVYQLVSEKDVVLYKMKEELVLKNTQSIFFDTKVSNEHNFQAVVSSPEQSILLDHGNPYSFVRTSSGYLSSPVGAYKLSPYFTQRQRLIWSDFSNYLLGFDESNSSFVYIKNGSQAINYFPDKYLVGSGEKNPLKMSSNNMSGKISFLENTAGSLDPISTAEHTRAYALFHSTTLTNKVVLLGLNMAELSGAGNMGANSPIRTADTLSNSYFLAASHYTLNKTSPTLYFANANVLHGYHIDNKVFIPTLYTFPVGEDISMMKYVNYSYTGTGAFKLNHLFVATFKGGRYKLYQFEVTGNSLKLIKTTEGEGKIKSIQYASVDSKEDSNMNYGVSTYY